MVDYGDFRILHPHDGEWSEMTREHHDAAEHDPERRWGRGAKLFKCAKCEERVVVVPRSPDEPE